MCWFQLDCVTVTKGSHNNEVSGVVTLEPHMLTEPDFSLVSYGTVRREMKEMWRKEMLRVPEPSMKDF